MKRPNEREVLPTARPKASPQECLGELQPQNIEKRIQVLEEEAIERRLQALEEKQRLSLEVSKAQADAKIFNQKIEDLHQSVRLLLRLSGIDPAKVPDPNPSTPLSKR
ncbi:hypothetical protein MMC25_005548 [Agyrium rufum]|nr:hypothetical protein [Agyrium rufum]